MAKYVWNAKEEKKTTHDALQRAVKVKNEFCIHLVAQEHYRYDHSHYYNISYFPDSHDLCCIQLYKYQHGGYQLLGSDLA